MNHAAVAVPCLQRLVLRSVIKQFPIRLVLDHRRLMPCTKPDEPGPSPVKIGEAENTSLMSAADPA
jgi:hypothetical protein